MPINLEAKKIEQTDSLKRRKETGEYKQVTSIPSAYDTRKQLQSE